MTPIEIFINILIYLDIYWMYITPSFAIGFYWILLQYFQMPLITNKIHELVLLVSPEKVKVKKVSNRIMPFFQTKNGIYWFDKPCHDVDSLNQMHVYIDEINQPITKMKRRPNKVNDLMTNLFNARQVISHKIIILRNLKKHFHRHWSLVVDPNTNMYQLSPVETKQPLKINFWHSIGIYIQEPQEVEVEKEMEATSGQNLKVKAMTTQTILQELKYIQEHSYYSSSYALNLWKQLVNIEKNYMTWLTGSVDMKVVLAFLAFMGVCGVALMFFLGYDPMANLGEMPTS